MIDYGLFSQNNINFVPLIPCFSIIYSELTHTLVPLYTLRKHQKTSGFLISSGGIVSD